MMIDIPLGKALVPVEDSTENLCKNCFFHAPKINPYHCLRGVHLSCPSTLHKNDGKNVIFKLVDYPVSEKKTP
jgi:hypothetical protein